VKGSDDVVIEWTNNHKSRYEFSWLLKHSWPRSPLLPPYDHQLPEPSIWKADSLNLPRLKYENVMKKEESVYEWLHYLTVTHFHLLFEIHSSQKYGLCLIEGVPAKKKTIEGITERIGHIRETFYGRIFDVESVPDAINVAYTNLPLELHQDLMYYETPPGLQLLHCIKQCHSGGGNFFTDGFTAAHILQNENPDEFDTLTRVPVTFHKRGVDHYFHYRRPIIRVDAGKVCEISYAPPFEGPLLCPPKLLEPFYRAYNTFTQILNRTSLVYKLRLEPSLLISFDNRRVLHGREPFELSKENGLRLLQGTYVDSEIYQSRFRALREKFPKPHFE
jgi:gamma-butyrobetaine dioxygenase